MTSQQPKRGLLDAIDAVPDVGAAYTVTTVETGVETAGTDDHRGGEAAATAGAAATPLSTSAAPAVVTAGGGLTSLPSWAASRHALRLANSARIAPVTEEEASALQTEKLISIAALPPRMQAAVKEFDDGDGHLSIFELQTSLRALESARTNNVRLRQYLCYAAVAVALLLVAICGMTFVAVRLAADTSVDDTYVMRVKGTDEPARTASADMTVSADGTLMTREVVAVDGSRRLLEADAIKPLATRATHMEHKLSSTMPDKYFKQLEFFEIRNDFGSSLAVRVHAVVRVPRKKSMCGSVLILVTQLGRITLDGDSMAFDDNIGAMFAEAGFGISNDADAALDYRRRLSDGTEIMGLFNFVGSVDEEWECPNVPAPEIPQDYTLTMMKWLPCPFAEDCAVDNKDGSFTLFPGAVEQPDGSLSMTVRQTMHVKGSSRVVVISEYPAFPFQKHVMDINFADGTREEYEAVFDDSSRIYRCTHVGIPENVPTGGIMNEDANFQYVGEADDNLRHFKLSFKAELMGYVDYRHVHFYDDAITHKPRRIIQDDGMQLQITSFEEGFGEPDLMVGDDQLNACLLETQEYVDNRTMDTSDDLRPPPASAFGKPLMSPFWSDQLLQRDIQDLDTGHSGFSNEMSQYLSLKANGTANYWIPNHSRRLARKKKTADGNDALALSYRTLKDGFTIKAAGGPFSLGLTITHDALGFKSLSASGEGCAFKIVCASADIGWSRGSSANGCIKIAFKPSNLVDLPILDWLPWPIYDAVSGILSRLDQDPLMKICLNSKHTYIGSWTGDFYRDHVPTLHVPDAFHLEAVGKVEFGIVKFEVGYDMIATQDKCGDLSTPRHLATQQTYHKLNVRGFYWGAKSLWDWDWIPLFDWPMLAKREGRGGSCKRCGRWKQHHGSQVFVLHPENNCKVSPTVGFGCPKKCPGYKIKESGS